MSQREWFILTCWKNWTWKSSSFQHQDSTLCWNWISRMSSFPNVPSLADVMNACYSSPTSTLVESKMKRPARSMQIRWKNTPRCILKKELCIYNDVPTVPGDLKMSFILPLMKWPTSTYHVQFQILKAGHLSHCCKLIWLELTTTQPKKWHSMLLRSFGAKGQMQPAHSFGNIL